MKKLTTIRTAGPWLITDSGADTAERNMAVDRKALEGMLRGFQKIPVVRFFRWQKSVITYGHLLDRSKVKEWARQNGNLDIVQRPTGGGAVIHHPEDLAVSFLWPRKSGLFPDNPRDCYAEIHATLRAGVRRYLGDAPTALFARPDEACDARPARANNASTNNEAAISDAAGAATTAANGPASPAGGQNRFSVCFEEPVCNDVMLGNRKIIGGALRVTRQAILYQGAVQLRRAVHAEKLQSCLLAALMDRLAPAMAETRGR